jgi:DNA repair protein RecO (recombination protein O)
LSDLPAEAPLGVVLRTTPLRESDLLVVLYTDVHGRVSAVARGARKSQRRFAGALSLLVLGRYQLGRRPRGDLWGLESADVVREWTQLSADVIAVAHASYVAELVGTLLPAEAPEPHALEIIVALWDALAAGGPSPGALRAVELALLDLAGHRPAIDHCAACSRTALDEGAVFDPERGGAICRSCAARSRGAGVRPFDPATRAYLHAVAELGTPIAARAVDSDPRFTSADRAAGRDAMVAMVVGLVGKPLRSLEYLAKLGAAGRRAKE